MITSAVESNRIDRIIARLDEIGMIETVAGVEMAYQVTRLQLLGRERHKGSSAARHALFYAIRHFSPREWSYSEIGRLLEIDHTSVIHGVRKHEKWLNRGSAKEAI